MWQFSFVSYLMVLSNLNPLVEYDGYYILMDLLDRPNLRRDCMRWLSDGLGEALRAPKELLAHRMELIYGLASLAYVVSMCALVFLLYQVLMEARVRQLGSIVFSEMIGWGMSVGMFVVAAVKAYAEARRE